MADLQQPSAAKRKLPFKRTVKRKSSDTVDDDGLSLFSRSGEFFEEQQRLAKEKAEKEKAEKAAEAAKAEQERKAREARERKSEHDALNERLNRGQEAAKRRRRISLSDDEKGDQDSDDDIFGLTPSKRQKTPSVPHTPSSNRESSFVASMRGSRGRLTRSQSRKAGKLMISLDDDDEDPFALKSLSMLSPTTRSRRISTKLESPLKHSSQKATQDAIALDEDDDPQVHAGDTRKEDEEEDPSEYYVRAAIERRRKAEEELQAREKAGSNTPGVEDEPVVKVLIYAHLNGVHTLMFRLKPSQKLTVLYQTWIEQQVAKHSLVQRAGLEEMFFTWKGNKVYQHTTLRTLGIKPERDGKLFPSWKKEEEGYQGRDQVYLEAWTQELYDEFLKEKEKQRLRDLGELDEEPEQTQQSEQPQTSQEDKKIRVHFKAKNLPAKNATVRSSTTAAQLIKVYRRLAEIPNDKTVELHWDGEVLSPDTTVEEAEIEDMDSLEVHIK
ncbi:hypothetical protein F4677DRAFT_224015 [Hypoxylon crocopeplum]|nr:hypothetical protein F4677DRAFT_224015 [Hypoxylon crocopeplum]